MTRAEILAAMLRAADASVAAVAEAQTAKNSNQRTLYESKMADAREFISEYDALECALKAADATAEREANAAAGDPAIRRAGTTCVARTGGRCHPRTTRARRRRGRAAEGTWPLRPQRPARPARNPSGHDCPVRRERVTRRHHPAGVRQRRRGVPVDPAAARPGR